MPPIDNIVGNTKANNIWINGIWKWSRYQKLATLKAIKDILGISFVEAKDLFEANVSIEIFYRSDVTTNKSVGVCYNNGDGSITIVMATTIEEAAAVELP